MQPILFEEHFGRVRWNCKSTSTRFTSISHNHPSGNLNPSQPDIDLTKKLKDGARTLDIQLLDHIIITKDSYYSFADEGIL